MEKKVQIIAASLDKVNRNKGKNTSKIRVAPYCRVSTNSEEQKNSYDSQLSYYKDLVDKKEEWELVDIYADEAISGTQTFNRTDFQRMISDALSGKIDLIVTKSISRFARNTLDTLKYVRMLKEKDVAIFFEKENINTLTMNGELLLVILSSVAQQESESISGNVKLGLKMKMKRGELVGFNKCLGYDYDKEDKSISINEEDAEIVKYIFERYSNGVGSFVIAKELTNLNYPTPNGLKYWQESTIRGILKNEKYKGDLLLGKTFIIDPITHRRLVNFGEVEKYYIKGHHEAIISEELFDKVQKITKKRKDGQNQSGRKEMYTRKYSFSGITKCGYCGATFMRRTWHSGSPHEKGVWSCHTHTKYGKQHCLSSKSISNQILESTFVDAYNLICKSNKELIADYLEVIQKAINHTSNVEEISKIEKNIELIDKKLKNLLEMKLNEEIDLCTYKEKNAQLNIEMFKLKARIDELNIYSSKEEEVNKRIMQFKKLFDEETTMKSFDREIFDCLVEKVIIGETSEDGTIEPYNIRFIFKTGNSVDTNIENNVKIKKRDKSLKVFSNQTDDTCGNNC